MSNKSNERRQYLLPHEVASLRIFNTFSIGIDNYITHKLQNAEERVNVPSSVRREALCRQTNLGGHAQFELVVGDLEERKKFADEDANIAFVDERVRQLQCAASN